MPPKPAPEKFSWELPDEHPGDPATRARLMKRHAKYHEARGNRDMAVTLENLADGITTVHGVHPQKPMSDDEFRRIFKHEPPEEGKDKAARVEEGIARAKAADARLFASWVRGTKPLPALKPKRTLGEMVEALFAKKPSGKAKKQRAASAKWDRKIAALGRQLQEQRARRRFLVECKCGDDLEADEAEPVLRGVRVLGSDSQNRRKYTQSAMEAALPLYNGAKVYCDHPDRPNESRSVDDLFGRLFNPRIEGGAIVADLKYNPAHPRAKQILWFAKNDPGALGLSHNAVGTGTTSKDGVFVVEKIAAVRSVDLVAEPATNSGLYANAA